MTRKERPPSGIADDTDPSQSLVRTATQVDATLAALPSKGKRKKAAVSASRSKPRKPGFLTQRLLHGFSGKPSRKAPLDSLALSDNSSVTMPSDYETHADRPPKIVVEDYIGLKVTPLTSMVEEQQRDLRSIVNELRQMEEYNSNVDVVHAGTKLLDRDDMHFLQVCTSKCPHVPAFEAIFENFGRVMPRPQDVALSRDFEAEDAALSTKIAEEAAAQASFDPILATPLTSHRSQPCDNESHAATSVTQVDGDPPSGHPQSTMDWKTSHQTSDISSSTDTLRSSNDLIEPANNDAAISQSNAQPCASLAEEAFSAGGTGAEAPQHLLEPELQGADVHLACTGATDSDHLQIVAAGADPPCEVDQASEATAPSQDPCAKVEESVTKANCMSPTAILPPGHNDNSAANSGEMMNPEKQVSGVGTDGSGAPSSDPLQLDPAEIPHPTEASVELPRSADSVATAAALDHERTQIDEVLPSVERASDTAEVSIQSVEAEGTVTESIMTAPEEVSTEEQAFAKRESATNTEIAGIVETATEAVDPEDKVAVSTETIDESDPLASSMEKTSFHSDKSELDASTPHVSPQENLQAEKPILSSALSRNEETLPAGQPQGFTDVVEEKPPGEVGGAVSMTGDGAMVVESADSPAEVTVTVADQGTDENREKVEKLVTPRTAGSHDEENTIEEQVQLPVLPDEADSSVDEKEPRVGFVCDAAEQPVSINKKVTIPIPTMPLELPGSVRETSVVESGVETSVLASVNRNYVLCSPRWAASLVPGPSSCGEREGGWLRGENTSDLQQLWLASHAVAHDWPMSPETSTSDCEDAVSESACDPVPFTPTSLRLLAVKHAVILGGARTEDDLPTPTDRSPRYAHLLRRHSAPALGCAVRACVPALCGFRSLNRRQLRSTWDSISSQGGRKRSPQELRKWEQQFDQARRLRSWKKAIRKRNGFSPTPSSPLAEEVILRQGEQAKALNRDDYHEEIERRFQRQLSEVRERMRQQAKRRGSQSSDLTKLLPLRNVMREASPKERTPEVTQSLPSSPPPVAPTPKIAAAKVVTETTVKAPLPKRKAVFTRALKPKPAPDQQTAEKEVVTDFRSVLKRTGRLEALAKAKGGSPKAVVSKTTIEHSAIRPSDARNLFERKAKEQEKSSGQTPSAEWFLQQVGKYQQT